MNIQDRQISITRIHVKLWRLVASTSFPVIPCQTFCTLPVVLQAKMSTLAQHFRLFPNGMKNPKIFPDTVIQIILQI